MWQVVAPVARDLDAALKFFHKPASDSFLAPAEAEMRQLLLRAHSLLAEVIAVKEVRRDWMAQGAGS